MPRARRFWSGELEVARIFDESHAVKAFRLVAPGGGPLPFDHAAGQYLSLALVIDGERVNRSYTLASSPTRRGFSEISVKRAPDGTAVREGSVLQVSAPARRFVFAQDQAERCVLIAGGVGITPQIGSTCGSSAPARSPRHVCAIGAVCAITARVEPIKHRIRSYRSC